MCIHVDIFCGLLEQNYGLEIRWDAAGTGIPRPYEPLLAALFHHNAGPKTFETNYHTIIEKFDKMDLKPELLRGIFGEPSIGLDLNWVAIRFQAWF